MGSGEARRQRAKRLYWNLRLFGLPEPMRDLWMVVVSGLVVWALIGMQGAIDRIDREGEERRDQTCGLFESDHLADVERLRRTYGYLRGLTREELGTPLNQAILRQLPDTENEARLDSAPSFCDEPGVGLPEPDPLLPSRPPGLP